jgi:hypothetical protein
MQHRALFKVIVPLLALMIIFSFTVLTESLYGSTARKNITITFLKAKILYAQDPSHVSKLTFSFAVKPSNESPSRIFYPKLSAIDDASNVLSIRSGSLINFPVDTVLHAESDKDLDISIIAHDYGFVARTGINDRHLTMQLDRKYNSSNNFGVGTHTEGAKFSREGSETLLIAYRISLR